jgi:hypothetical protein
MLLQTRQEGLSVNENKQTYLFLSILCIYDNNNNIEL